MLYMSYPSLCMPDSCYFIMNPGLYINYIQTITLNQLQGHKCAGIGIILPKNKIRTLKLELS